MLLILLSGCKPMEVINKQNPKSEVRSVKVSRKIQYHKITGNINNFL
ncbi:hypothetical protein BSPA14S_K0031 (plasmid) [Borreliella spielmanii A14S]|uniref:Uncharacterized protein n=1 Tax=Borreliella spielmanii A14S TaxID=498742 RepID=C0RBU1_9SPIR|nr:hypothetical protein BSPA14S_K0031 [Borreliella spielmanii A14S]